MTAAAKELTATQPAVSQHIRSLENHLDTVLFVKSGRKLKPTSAAEVYYQKIQLALNTIAEQSEILRNSKRNPEINIIAHTGLASFWLLPKLPMLKTQLKAQCKEQWSAVTINVTLSDVDKPAMSIDDLPLQFGRFSDYPQAIPLLTESVCVIAGRAYAKTHHLSSHSAIDEVLRHPLIHMDERDNRWLNWRDFLLASDCILSEGREKVLLGNYHSVISQTRRNQGLALGWRGIIDELLADGALVKVTSVEHRRADYGYFIDTAGLDNRRLAVAHALFALISQNLIDSE